MNVFTNDDYRRIQKWLKANAIKDSDFASTEGTVPEEDILVITQNMATVPTNYKIKIKDLLNSSLGKVVIDSITAKSVKVNNVLTVDAANVKLDNEKGTTLQDVLDYFEENKLNRHTDDTFDGNLTIKKDLTIEGHIKSDDGLTTVEENFEATGEITDGDGNMLSDVNYAAKGWNLEFQDPHQEEPTVRAKYVLKDYKGVPKGDVIKVYKDSAITNVYLGTTEDTCNPDTGVPTKHPIHDNNEALCIVYHLENGKYNLVPVPLGAFVREAEFDKYRGFGITTEDQVFIKLANDVESTNYLHFNALGEISADGIETRILRDLGDIVRSVAGDGTMWGQYKQDEGTKDGSTSGDNSRWGQFKEAEALREATSDSAHTVFADDWDEQDDDPEDYDPFAVVESSYAYNWKTTDSPASDGKTQGNLKDVYNKSLEHTQKLSELEGRTDNLNIQINGGSPSVEVVWERGGITSSNGQDSTSTSTRNIRVNGYIERKSVSKIVWKNTENTNRIYLYDANKAFIKYVFMFESVTDDAVYLRASITAPDGVVADYDNWQQYVDIVLVATDKSIVGDINSLKSQVEILDSKRYAPTKLVQFSSPNGNYNTYGAIGASASLVFTPNTTDWLNVVEDAEKGDIFVITGVGGTSPKTWAFIDTEDNNKILLTSASNEVCDKKIIVAPKKCKLYCNFKMYPFQMYPQVEKALSGISTTNIDVFTRIRNVSEKPLEIIEPFYMASVIHSWGFIGDSLMSGYTDAKLGSIYEYSWGQRMCKFLGSEGFNFSYGGQTAKGWIEGYEDEDKNARCWFGAQTNLKQAYIIGLGVNDRKDYQDGKIMIGSVATDVKSDYTQNADTFAGNYAGIIQRLRSVRPNSPIFLVNMPYKLNVGVGYLDINRVISDCAEKFDNVWLIDLWKNGINYSDKAFEEKFVSGSHLNYIGYQYVAMQMTIYINWIIENNLDSFKDIGLIDYEHE